MKLALSEKIEQELARRAEEAGLSGTDLARLILSEALFGPAVPSRSQMVPNGPSGERGTFKEGKEAGRGEGVGGEGEAPASPASSVPTQKLLATPNEESTGARTLQPSGQEGLLEAMRLIAAQPPELTRELAGKVSTAPGDAGSQGCGQTESRGGSDSGLQRPDPGLDRGGDEPPQPEGTRHFTGPVAQRSEASDERAQLATGGSGFESRSAPTHSDPIAQWTKRRGPNATVGGSNPPGITNSILGTGQGAATPSPVERVELQPRPAAKRRGSRLKAAPAVEPDPPACFGPKLLEAIQGFRRFREEVRKPLTPEGVRRLYLELERWPDELGIQAIGESVLNGWRGLFLDELAAKKGAKPRVPTNGTNVPAQPPAIPLTKIERLRRNRDASEVYVLHDDLVRACPAWAGKDPERNEVWASILETHAGPENLEKIIEFCRVVSPALIGEEGADA